MALKKNNNKNKKPVSIHEMDGNISHDMIAKDISCVILNADDESEIFVFDRSATGDIFIREFESQFDKIDVSAIDDYQLISGGAFKIIRYIADSGESLSQRVNAGYNDFKAVADENGNFIEGTGLNQVGRYPLHFQRPVDNIAIKAPGFFNRDAGSIHNSRGDLAPLSSHRGLLEDVGVKGFLLML